MQPSGQKTQHIMHFMHALLSISGCNVLKPELGVGNIPTPLLDPKNISSQEDGAL